MTSLKSKILNATAFDVLEVAAPNNHNFLSGMRYALDNTLAIREALADVAEAAESLPTLIAGNFQVDSPLGELSIAISNLEKLLPSEGEG